MLKKVDSRGRLTIPQSVLQQTKIKPGDKVTFEFHPLRGGNPGGQLISVVLPGGKKLAVIGNAGAGPRQD